MESCGTILFDQDQAIVHNRPCDTMNLKHPTLQTHVPVAAAEGNPTCQLTVQTAATFKHPTCQAATAAVHSGLPALGSRHTSLLADTNVPPAAVQLPPLLHLELAGRLPRPAAYT